MPRARLLADLGQGIEQRRAGDAHQAYVRVIQFQYQKNRARDRKRADQKSNDHCRAKRPNPTNSIEIQKTSTARNGQGIELLICSIMSARVWRMAPLISSTLFWMKCRASELGESFVCCHRSRQPRHGRPPALAVPAGFRPSTRFCQPPLKRQHEAYDAVR